MDSFSQRHGLVRPDAEITIRNDAPPQVRDAAIQIAYRSGLKPSDLRASLCQILFRAPDRNNWSEFPNIDGEVCELIDDCEWFEVYDLIEMLAAKSAHRGQSYADEMNRFFEPLVSAGSSSITVSRPAAPRFLKLRYVKVRWNCFGKSGKPPQPNCMKR